MNGPNAEKAVSIVNLFILIGFAILRSLGQKEPGGSEGCEWGLICFSISIWKLLVWFRTKQAGLIGHPIWLNSLGQRLLPYQHLQPFQSLEYCSTINRDSTSPCLLPLWMTAASFFVVVFHNLRLAAKQADFFPWYSNSCFWSRGLKLPRLWYHRMEEVERFAQISTNLHNFFDKINLRGRWPPKK